MRRVAISMVLGTMLLLGIIASPAQAGSAARSNSGRAAHAGKVGHVARPASIASFKQYLSPVAKYTSKTCEIDLSAIADFTPVSSVTGCGVTVSFSSTLEKRSVPGSWQTWGSPPDTEGNTPNILYSAGATSITLTSSAKHRHIGVEVEPNNFAVETFVATFRKGNGNPIGSVTRDIDGNAGARLMAGHVGLAKKQWVKYLDITDLAGFDFAIARIRVS